MDFALFCGAEPAIKRIQQNGMVILLGKEIIMLSSVTYAYKARDFLYSYGIRSRVIKTPPSLSTCGCGYSLEVDAGTPALLMLQQERFPIKKTQIVER